LHQTITVTVISALKSCGGNKNTKPCDSSGDCTSSCDDDDMLATMSTESGVKVVKVYSSFSSQRILGVLSLEVCCSRLDEGTETLSK